MIWIFHLEVPKKQVGTKQKQERLYDEQKNVTETDQALNTGQPGRRSLLMLMNVRENTKSQPTIRSASFATSFFASSSQPPSVSLTEKMAERDWTSKSWSSNWKWRFCPLGDGIARRWSRIAGEVDWPLKNNRIGSWFELEEKACFLSSSNIFSVSFASPLAGPNPTKNFRLHSGSQPNRQRFTSAW